MDNSAHTNTTLRELQMHTTAEVARRLKVAVWTVNKWCREGKLGSYRIGGKRLISDRDVEEFIAARRESPGKP